MEMNVVYVIMRLIDVIVSIFANLHNGLVLAID